MGVHSPKRRFLATAVVLFAAAPLFALSPTARNEARMVYAQDLHRVVLFGGSTPVDRGTKLSYELNDTWEKTSSRWIQRFPAHSPSPRGAHVMVYDPQRARVVLFGGRTGTTAFNDTWIYKNGDWTKLDTATTPPGRFLAGAAYDSKRDRIVVFGGSSYSADGKSLVTLTDTWEFDGTNWIQRSSSGPDVSKPMLVYDAANDQVLMLGLTTKSETLMYQYDAAAGTWKQLTPTTLPACVNEGMLLFNAATQKPFFSGGVCAGSSATEDNLEWDGSNWKKLDVLTNAGRVFGAASAYDTDNSVVVLFGGTDILGVTRSSTFLFSGSIWLDASSAAVDPAPRSLFSFVTDPVNNTIWMFGGIDDTQTFDDFWKYQNGHWEQVVTGTEPTACIYPIGSYDTDRQKMVVVCNNSSIWEFDGSAWKSFTDLKELPPARRFSSMAYDATLKKTVLFGGWNASYFDQTWTWDGTVWTRVKKNPPPSRALAAMWYDPSLKKTVLYGGLGRLTSTDRLSRFSDMWTFDGSSWTELKPSGGTPGQRYGAEVSVDPRNNKVVLFGGLRVDTSDSGIQTQVYADDTWEWDGTAWNKLAPSVVPPARENAGLTFDPIRNELVMFSGFAGHYFSDTWGYTNGAWHLRIENNTQRRRAAH
jgi:hypothetical protein